MFGLYVWRRGGTTFHRDGGGDSCAFVERIAPAELVTGDSKAATKGGRLPCKRCCRDWWEDEAWPGAGRTPVEVYCDGHAR